MSITENQRIKSGLKYNNFIFAFRRFSFENRAPAFSPISDFWIDQILVIYLPLFTELCINPNRFAAPSTALRIKLRTYRYTDTGTGTDWFGEHTTPAAVEAQL